MLGMGCLGSANQAIGLFCRCILSPDVYLLAFLANRRICQFISSILSVFSHAQKAGPFSSRIMLKFDVFLFLEGSFGNSIRA